MVGTTADERVALDTDEPGKAGTKTCLLVIDDEPLVRDFVESTLAALGYEILVAGDGQEGLERFQEHADRVDGVILDMLMPRLDGRETFLRLRSMRAELPVLITTGYAGSTDLQTLVADRRVRLLLKPFGQQELSGEVVQLFGSP